MHESRNLSCVTCHSVHNPKSEVAQLKTATVTGTCVNCHKQKWPSCSASATCRFARASWNARRATTRTARPTFACSRPATGISESCLSCHTEKRGPYLWDHAPVREACSTCHDPHGSNQERMLVAKMPMLCQRCHIGTKHPSTIYDGNQLESKSSRLIGRSCVNCHSQIHGSIALPATRFYAEDAHA
jgi:DmsE family decaheme c-type cytochrome